MNLSEAQIVLSNCLKVFRGKPYAELAAMAGQGQIKTHELAAPSGIRYQVEIQFFWDNEPNANVRVMGSIDDGSIRALHPISEVFIVSPQGRFIEKGSIR